MQYPAGMEFDPDQMRNVMANFWEVAFSPVAVNKYFHTVFSGWALAGIFVIGVSAWMLLKKRNTEMAIMSTKIGAVVGLAGMLLTMGFGDGSAKVVSRVQPMKLAAMEGLYVGEKGQSIVAAGIINPEKKYNNDEDPYIFDISIPGGLAFLARGDFNAFVPGVKDIIEGRDINADGDTINTVPYAERIARGKAAHAALREFDIAKANGDKAAMDAAHTALKADYQFFGYGYMDSVEEAIPNIPLVFYSFHIMVILGSFLFAVLIFVLLLIYKKKEWLTGS